MNTQRGASARLQFSVGNMLRQESVDCLGDEAVPLRRMVTMIVKYGGGNTGVAQHRQYIQKGYVLLCSEIPDALLRVIIVYAGLNLCAHGKSDNKKLEIMAMS